MDRHAQPNTLARRTLLAALAGTSAFLALPARWQAPHSTFGVLPAHAATSGTTPGPIDAGFVNDDAGGLDAGIAICRVPLVLDGEFEGRPIYRLHVDMSGTEECALVAPGMAAFEPFPLGIGFLSGSPGYSIDIVTSYTIDAVANGQVVDAPRSVNAFENQMVRLTLSRATPVSQADAGDAGVVANRWIVRFTLEGDPTNAPAACVVALYELTAMP